MQNASAWTYVARRMPPFLADLLLRRSHGHGLSYRSLVAASNAGYALIRNAIAWLTRSESVYLRSDQVRVCRRSQYVTANARTSRGEAGGENELLFYPPACRFRVYLPLDASSRPTITGSWSDDRQGPSVYKDA